MTWARYTRRLGLGPDPVTQGAHPFPERTLQLPRKDRLAIVGDLQLARGYPPPGGNAVNTALELDIYGHVNSTHVMGSQLIRHLTAHPAPGGQTGDRYLRPPGLPGPAARLVRPGGAHCGRPRTAPARRGLPAARAIHGKWRYARNALRMATEKRIRPGTFLLPTFRRTAKVRAASAGL